MGEVKVAVVACATPILGQRTIYDRRMGDSSETTIFGEPICFPEVADPEVADPEIAKKNLQARLEGRQPGSTTSVRLTFTACSPLTYRMEESPLKGTVAYNTNQQCSSGGSKETVEADLEEKMVAFVRDNPRLAYTEPRFQDLARQTIETIEMEKSRIEDRKAAMRPKK